MSELYRNKDWLYHQYVVLKLSTICIANKCGVVRETIRYWLIKWNIKIRDRSGARKLGLKKYGNPMKDKKHSEETKQKMSDSHKGKIIPIDVRVKMSNSSMGRKKSKEHRKNISKGKIGKYTGNESHAWKGGTSFLPYCPAFNEKKKEEIRNRDNRTCQLCNKSEILNGKRLSVHHIDGDKMQGCTGKKWYLIALCQSCNSKTDNIEKEFLIVSNIDRRGMKYVNWF